MKSKFTVHDKKLIRVIQGDLPLTPTPFASWAGRMHWEEERVLRGIQRLLRQGAIRRFGAILRHQKAGYLGNAMVVWNVPEEQIGRVSQIMIAFARVSHCYLRPSSPQWPYNLYTMVHGQDEKDCHQLAKKIARKTGIKEYRLLFSKKEYKKSSMKYF